MTEEGEAADQKKAGSWFHNYKLRFTLGGVIVSIISLILIGVLGYKPLYVVLLIIGIVALSIGVLMKKKKEE